MPRKNAKTEAKNSARPNARKQSSRKLTGRKGLSVAPVARSTTGFNVETIITPRKTG